MNSIPCYLRILDQNDNDVTYKVANASYCWYDQPKTLYRYKKNFYLSGGMIMNLKLKEGIYKIQFYTPKDKVYGYDDLKKDWNSNTFIYNTESKLIVIFVTPTTNDNYFYNGGWYIDYKSPKYRGFTVPKYLEIN